jgi:hypothetical protein
VSNSKHYFWKRKRETKTEPRIAHERQSKFTAVVRKWCVSLALDTPYVSRLRVLCDLLFNRLVMHFLEQQVAKAEKKKWCVTLALDTPYVSRLRVLCDLLFNRLVMHFLEQQVAKGAKKKKARLGKREFSQEFWQRMPALSDQRAAVDSVGRGTWLWVMR